MALLTALSTAKLSADLLKFKLRSRASWVSLPNQELIVPLINWAEIPNKNTPGNTATKVNIPDSRRAICEPNTLLLLSRIKSTT
ncbi:Uncharacterised protein [Mycobacteroides abscessus subsp. massiliense]|nr:Uncharacterised protein [Mycobacteroides abscessus subsp. massiliense]